MLSPTHVFVANLYSRLFKGEWPPGKHFLFCLGALLPDLPALIVGFVEWRKYLLYHGQLNLLGAVKSLVAILCRNERAPVVEFVFTNINYYNGALWLTQCFHSIIFWLLVLGLYLLLRSPKGELAAMAYGAIFFHVFIDWPTHTVYAHAYLWPLIRRPIPGFVSYDNHWLFLLEVAISIIWLRGIFFPFVRRLVVKPKT